MLIEQKLPLGVKLEDAQLAEPAERDRLMRAFERGLDRPVGYVLPLLVSHTPGGERRWTTERWAFRRGNLFLIPGASPVGLRLPLAGLREIDLRRLSARAAARSLRSATKPASLPRSDCSTKSHKLLPSARSTRPAPVRTALALEVRDGHLHVFLPPLADGDGLRRASCRHRESRHRHRPAHPPRRLRAAVRPARRLHQGDARPGCHRGQRAPGSVVAGRRSRSPRPSTTKHSR